MLTEKVVKTSELVIPDETTMTVDLESAKITLNFPTEQSGSEKKSPVLELVFDRPEYLFTLAASILGLDGTEEVFGSQAVAKILDIHPQVLNKLANKGAIIAAGERGKRKFFKYSLNNILSFKVFGAQESAE